MITSRDSGTLAEMASYWATQADNAKTQRRASSLRKRSVDYVIASAIARHQELTELGIRSGLPYDGALSVLVDLENAGYTIVRKRSWTS